MHVDQSAPLTFLGKAFEPEDWIAVLLKCHRTGLATQRVAPVATISAERFQRWLRLENTQGRSVYVSVNGVVAHQRHRRRDSIAAIRHLFLDADACLTGIHHRIRLRMDLPDPFCVIRTSPDRGHVLWRVCGFRMAAVESLQKRLARDLGTDRAATAPTQMTRLPGFLNHKYGPATLVTVQYGAVDATCPASALPRPEVSLPPREMRRRPSSASSLERARAYAEATPPAVSGRRGDVHTFRLCCRLVRGVSLTDDDAIRVLRDWNGRCEPPWSVHELQKKLDNARCYGGRECAGGLLKRPP